MIKKQNVSAKEIFVIGLMLFALFFGAGNLIFPPLLGQQAGTNVWIAIFGFLVTGVGLPLLAVIAVARSGGDLQTLASRVHPVFGLIFSVTMFLAIGPFFGIPRTGTVAYEIGIIPFLSENIQNNSWPLIIYTVIFFSLTALLALNPSKIVDRIGKILTPILIIVLALLVWKNFLTPMGSFQEPTGAYVDFPFFKGFIDGYLTMDTIAALVFGIVIFYSIREKGVIEVKQQIKICVYAGLIAAAGLVAVYLSLAFIGATSTEAIGLKENGGAILSASAAHLYGSLGAVILGLAITFACLTTSIGLVSSCATYFSKLVKPISYRAFVIVLSLFSMMIANVGLTELIAISEPVLMMIYPLGIVLILLSFLDPIFKGKRSVYVGALIPTGIISIVDGLSITKIDLSLVIDIFSLLPLFEEKIGWLLPAIIGGIIGLILDFIFRK